MLTTEQELAFNKLFERALQNYKEDKRDVLHEENASVLLDGKIILTVRIGMAPYRGEKGFDHGGG